MKLYITDMSLRSEKKTLNLRDDGLRAGKAGGPGAALGPGSSRGLDALRWILAQNWRPFCLIKNTHFLKQFLLCLSSLSPCQGT